MVAEGLIVNRQFFFSGGYTLEEKTKWQNGEYNEGYEEKQGGVRTGSEGGKEPSV